VPDGRARRPRCGRLAAAAVLLTGLTGCARGEEARLTLVSTHTLEDSGLLDTLTAQFRRDHPDQKLRVVVVGSGEALALGRRGDADVLLTHAPDAELDFVRAGYGSERREVMFNDFLLVGPAGDPAGARRAPDAAAAFDSVRAHGARFVSRADDSGTHRMEQRIWAGTGSTARWPGFAEAGVGMADALRLAAQRGAYLLTDRATWTVLRDQLRLEVAHEGDPLLRNTYSVIRVVEARNRRGAAAFADWLTGADAARVMTGYRGGGLFFSVEP
jgi:tungstate transport system substrate-binding protein